MAVLNRQSCLTLQLLILFTLLNLCTARADLEKSDDILESYLNAPPFGSLEKRQNDGCTPVTYCSPSTCTGEVCPLARRKKKRNLPVIAISSNGNFTELDPDDGLAPDSDTLGADADGLLAKRALRRVYVNRLESYLEGQNTQAHLIGLCPADAGGYWAPSYCVQYRFSDPNIPVDATTGQMLIGTGSTELTGCTVLTIASSRGVYMCHFWEDINYPLPEYPQREGRPQLGFQPVLNMLRGQGDRPFSVGPPIDTSLFIGEHTNTWAFICTPRPRATTNDPATIRHVPQQEQLVALLTNLIPGIGIVNYNYDTMGPYNEYYRGVALFEYDRNADGSGNADWRLWYEASNEMGTRLGQDPAGLAS
ncbi:hypothetical protein BDV12DRAFT_62043 [Aspergillus spectabilis]